MRFLPFLLFIVAFSASSQPTSAPCDTAQHALMNFWVGEWDLTWPGGQGGTPEGETGSGINVITSELANCVIRESFSGEGFNGLSLSIFDARGQTWRQTWVDDQGGYIAFTGGMTEDGTMEFRTSPFTDSQGMQRVNRMIWTDVRENSLTWHWQTSSNGEAPWVDLWAISYRRR